MFSLAFSTTGQLQCLPSGQHVELHHNLGISKNLLMHRNGTHEKCISGTKLLCNFPSFCATEHSVNPGLRSSGMSCLDGKLPKTRTDGSQIYSALGVVGGKWNHNMGSQRPDTDPSSTPGLAGWISSTSAASALSVAWWEETKGG